MTRDLKIDELRTLLAVAEAGTLANAASVIGRSTSAVSLQLKRLEESIGTDLFERDGRRLRLTLAGIRVLESGRRLIAMQHDLRTIAREAGDRDNGDDDAYSGDAMADSSDAFSHLGPFTPASGDRPLRVEISETGEFRGMQPVTNFRESLSSPFLVTAHDYFSAAAEKGEALRLGPVEAIARRCAKAYIIAEVRAQGDHCRFGAVASNLDLVPPAGNWQGAALADCLTGLSLSSRRQVFAICMSERTCVHYCGPGASHTLTSHHVRVLLVPARGPGPTDRSLLAICEVSDRERYIVPPGAEPLMGIPETVIVSPHPLDVPPLLLCGETDIGPDFKAGAGGAFPGKKT